MEKWKDYTGSKKMFVKNEKTQGFINWEIYHDNFKLESWNMINPINNKLAPTIIKFFKDGNGYILYRSE